MPEEEGGSSRRGGYSPVDRSFLDRSMGKKISVPKVEGEGKVSIKVAEPKDVGDTPKGLFKPDTVERQTTMHSAETGPEVNMEE